LKWNAVIRLLGLVGIQLVYSSVALVGWAGLPGLLGLSVVSCLLELNVGLVWFGVM